jgi:hypothetical protein
MVTTTHWGFRVCCGHLSVSSSSPDPYSGGRSGLGEYTQTSAVAPEVRVMISASHDSRSSIIGRKVSEGIDLIDAAFEKVEWVQAAARADSAES